MSRIIQSRRGLIAGFAALLAAPAIVRASSLMPIKPPTPSLAIHPEFAINVDGFVEQLVAAITQGGAEASRYIQEALKGIDTRYG